VVGSYRAAKSTQYLLFDLSILNINPTGGGAATLRIL